ncbi:polyprenol phosphomannose-dependent alpha 1,6 mannosyltransferase MptB [Catenuloplanes atrovinosus]|uniref:Alpha-1,6-mannosyltransferase n=1 Tax=Catenuloplanes atrovinosus TaxID=137266 RepID=A0AAE3YSU3_9ACTN|nr:polyprenol phosphomannose-dependent alpha 1,6 mannosyltransferase MptB [Catenuloplanes atrovinosus]MDR7279020.1 alpha-1,6-mannosyltransferase [Catenuloplanes atrovinosus]
MSSPNAILERTLPEAPPRGRRVSARALAAVGAVATATLTVVTAGVLRPGVATMAAGLIAMGVVIGAWFLSAGVSTRRLYAVAAAWAAPLLLARPLFSGDVWSYLAQGATAARGLDPYRLGPASALGADSVFAQQVSHYWADTPAPYGPAWLLVSRGVALLTGEQLTAGVLAYRTIALAGIVLIAWALPRLAARAGADPGVAVRLGLLNPLVLWHLVAGVHNDALMLGLMLAGLELALTGLDRPLPLVAGVALLTAAANIKFVAGAAFCMLLIAMAHRLPRPARPMIAVVAGALAGTAALSMVAGFGWITGPLGSLTVYSWMSPTTATGLLIGAIAGPDVTPTAVAIANTIGLTVGVPVVIMLLIAVSRRRLDPVRGLGLIFTAALLCGAVVQPWYVLWAVLPLAAAVRTPRQQRRIAAVSTVVALALPPMTGSVPAMITGYLIAAVVLALAAVLLRRFLRRAVTGQAAAPHATRPNGAASRQEGVESLVTRLRDGEAVIPHQRGVPMPARSARDVAPL